jgi:hypothetical protein
MSNPVLEKWNELKVIMESLEIDIHKNVGGNASAGTRARKGLRLIKTVVGDLVKESLSQDKDRKS